jgi:hypothetical protein
LCLIGYVHHIILLITWPHYSWHMLIKNRQERNKEEGLPSYTSSICLKEAPYTLDSWRQPLSVCVSVLFYLHYVVISFQCKYFYIRNLFCPVLHVGHQVMQSKLWCTRRLKVSLSYSATWSRERLKCLSCHFII